MSTGTGRGSGEGPFSNSRPRLRPTRRGVFRATPRPCAGRWDEQWQGGCVTAPFGSPHGSSHCSSERAMGRGEGPQGPPPRLRSDIQECPGESQGGHDWPGPLRVTSRTSPGGQEDFQRHRAREQTLEPSWCQSSRLRNGPGCSPKGRGSQDCQAVAQKGEFMPSLVSNCSFCRFW